jgi:hypothetical protein
VDWREKKVQDSAFLNWIHDRLANVHGENKDVDYMIRLRQVIERLKKNEGAWDEFWERRHPKAQAARVLNAIADKTKSAKKNGT